MTEATFEIFDWFLKVLGREITPEARQHYYDEFKNVPDEAFVRAIKSAANEHPPGQLLSVRMLRRYVDDECERLEQRRHKEKIPETEPDRKQVKTELRSLIVELEQREAAKKQREVETLEREHQERIQRRNEQTERIKKQAKSLLLGDKQDQTEWIH